MLSSDNVRIEGGTLDSWSILQSPYLFWRQFDFPLIKTESPDRR